MHRFVPKLIICWKEGYSRAILLRDLAAGLTVGIIALPLAMAFGIASIPAQVAADVGLSPPAMGLYTAVIAGFLISALGGSRVQIGGPTGAFIVIIYSIASQHGYSGLAIATLMAGMIVIMMGITGIGAMIKFVPYPVTTGFTAGIAVIIFSSQIRDFLGLETGALPVEFVEKWATYIHHADTASWATAFVGMGTLVVLILLRRLAPRVPAAIVAVALATIICRLFELPVETIGQRLGNIPNTLPMPSLPDLDWSQVRALIPDATTIAMLVAIESLLSAVVADGMTGGRHKADCELVAQGVANIACVFFGGVPATGAIARTTANIKSGARTPLAGMIHAVVLLLFMMLLATPASAVPLASLAAVLIVVAWNMSELDHFRRLLRAPIQDRLVLLTTFGLTIFVDLTVAVGVGMVLASLLFMKRMADISDISSVRRELADDENGTDSGLRSDPGLIENFEIPPGCEVYEINGPFFFGMADRLKDVLASMERPPNAFVLRLRRVPYIDATGFHALENFYHKCHRQGTTLMLAEVHAHVIKTFMEHDFIRIVGRENVFGDLGNALASAARFGAAPGGHSHAGPSPGNTRSGNTGSGNTGDGTASPGSARN